MISWSCLICRAWRLRAGLAQIIGLGLAAPLGHRFGEIREADREPQPQRDLQFESDQRQLLPARTFLTRMIVTARAVTSTTNITGLRAWMRGSNLRIESTSAPLTMSLSHSAVALRSAIGNYSCLQNSLPCIIARCSTMGPSASAGKKVSAATIRITATSRITKMAPLVGKVPALARNRPFGRQRTGQREHRHLHHETPEQHHDRERHIVERCVGVESAEGRSVVGGRLAVRIQHLARSHAGQDC